MVLPRPFVCTLATNIDENANVIDENLQGQAIMAFVFTKEVINEAGQKQFVQYPVFGVIWEDRVSFPAMCMYKNEDIASLGMSDEFESEEDEEDDDEDEDEEESED